MGFCVLQYSCIHHNFYTDNFVSYIISYHFSLPLHPDNQGNRGLSLDIPIDLKNEKYKQMKYKFNTCVLVLCLSGIFSLYGQTEIKNVILMIPDGTSSSLLSIARWYNFYQNPEKKRLTIDDYLCGYVKTHCSDSPVGDSAPTTSCYVTGIPSQAGFISTYPPVTRYDLVDLDSSMAYQPLITLLEAAKYVHQKSTGLVFTCEFPHATPADCAAHTFDRTAYPTIAKQMIYNNIDVVIGGGVNHLQSQEKEYLLQQGYKVLIDDIDAFRNSTATKLWSLFEGENMPYIINRDLQKTPSLAEMTRKAIKALSQNENGFFLMIEGSLIDWAAHDNDVKAMIGEFLDFDAAVAEAVNFANRNGETVVVILPDHATGGISLGSRNSNSGYAQLSLDTIMRNLQTFIGFTSYGHTGEDVFLAVYHPANDLPTGLRTNTEIHHYLCRQMQLEDDLPVLTAQLFAPHHEVFKGINKLKTEIDSIAPEKVILHVKLGKNKLEIESNTNYYIFNGVRYPLSSVTVYQSKNGIFYLPAKLRDLFLGEKNVKSVK
jgi:alkaline phosphatase